MYSDQSFKDALTFLRKQVRKRGQRGLSAHYHIRRPTLQGWLSRKQWTRRARLCFWNSWLRICQAQDIDPLRPAHSGKTKQSLNQVLSRLPCGDAEVTTESWKEHTRSLIDVATFLVVELISDGVSITQVVSEKGQVLLLFPDPGFRTASLEICRPDRDKPSVLVRFLQDGAMVLPSLEISRWSDYRQLETILKEKYQS